MISRFIGGRTIQKAIERMSNSIFYPIYDYAKESSSSPQDVWKYMERIKNDVKVPVQPSAFALKYSSFNDDMYMKQTIKYMLPHVSMLLLDAEHNELYEKEQTFYDGVIEEFNGRDIKVYKTYQMYRKDSLNCLIEDIKKHHNLGIKLVRGAYYERDSNKNVLCQSKQDTDKHFDDAVIYTMGKMKEKNLKLLIATHNNVSINATLTSSKFSMNKERIYFAQLLGMNDKIGYNLVSNGCKVYKYVPYGNFSDTLPYLTRRLVENYDILKYVL